MSAMLQLLTGTGLAASTGLNAYIPLLAVGLLARYTGAVTLPAGWDWLSNGWVLVILAWCRVSLWVVTTVARGLRHLVASHGFIYPRRRAAAG